MCIYIHHFNVKLNIGNKISFTVNSVRICNIIENNLSFLKINIDMISVNKFNKYPWFSSTKLSQEIRHWRLNRNELQGCPHKWLILVKACVEPATSRRQIVEFYYNGQIVTCNESQNKQFKSELYIKLVSTDVTWTRISYLGSPPEVGIACFCMVMNFI